MPFSVNNVKIGSALKDQNGRRISSGTPRETGAGGVLASCLRASKSRSFNVSSVISPLSKNKVKIQNGTLSGIRWRY